MDGPPVLSARGNSRELYTLDKIYKKKEMPIMPISLTELTTRLVSTISATIWLSPKMIERNGKLFCNSR